MNRNIGIATAYGYALSKGYTGTEEEFAELMARLPEFAGEAEASAQEAQAYAANAYMQTLRAEAWTVGEIGGEDVPQSDPTYQNNSRYYAVLAGQRADSAGSNATAAEDAQTAAANSATAAAGSAAAAASSAAGAAAAQTAAETARAAAEAAQEAAEDAIPAIQAAIPNAASVSNSGLLSFRHGETLLFSVQLPLYGGGTE